jgi:hypothetical protein
MMFYIYILLLAPVCLASRLLPAAGLSAWELCAKKAKTGNPNSRRLPVVVGSSVTKAAPGPDRDDFSIFQRWNRK